MTNIINSGSICAGMEIGIYPKKRCGFAENTTAWEEFLLTITKIFDEREQQKQLSFYYSSSRSEKNEQRIRFLNMYNSLEQEDAYWTEMSYYQDSDFLQDLFDG